MEIKKAVGEGYSIPFSNLEAGMSRRINYETANPEPKPFGKHFIFNN